MGRKCNKLMEGFAKLTRIIHQEILSCPESSGLKMHMKRTMVPWLSIFKFNAEHGNISQLFLDSSILRKTLFITRYSSFGMIGIVSCSLRE